MEFVTILSIMLLLVLIFAASRPVRGEEFFPEVLPLPERLTTNIFNDHITQQHMAQHDDVGTAFITDMSTGSAEPSFPSGHSAHIAPCLVPHALSCPHTHYRVSHGKPLRTLAKFEEHHTTWSWKQCWKACAAQVFPRCTAWKLHENAICTLYSGAVVELHYGGTDASALMPGTTAEAHFAALGGLNSKMNVELREVFDQGHDALHEEKTLSHTNSITATEAKEEVVDGSMALQRLLLRELTHDNTGGGGRGGGGEDERTAEAGEKACPPEGGTSAECGLHGYGIMNGAWNSIKTLFSMPSPSQWRECVKVCANVPRCTAWHKRGRYCDLFTGERATLEKAAGHEISGLMQGSTAAANYHKQRIWAESVLKTPTCATFGSPWEFLDSHVPPDEFEEKWELGRASSKLGDNDNTVKLLHLRAVMGSWSFESFEDTHGAGGVALPEAESWTRWRTGSRCCSSATAFGEESSVPSTNFYVHMNNPLGRHPDPHHFMGCGTHLDWKECHHGGEWDLGEDMRWTGTAGYDGPILRALAGLAQLKSEPGNGAAARGSYAPMESGWDGADQPDPVLSEQTLLPTFPFPLDARGAPTLLNEFDAERDGVASSAESACAVLLQTTPVQSYTPLSQPPRQFASSSSSSHTLRLRRRRRLATGGWEGVLNYLRKLPGWSNGTHHIVADNFVDGHWGDQYCSHMNPMCTKHARFDTDDAMVHKSDMHCRAYRPFFDIAMPLPVLYNWVAPTPHAHGITLRAQILGPNAHLDQRPITFFFKGSKTESGIRHELALLHDPSNGIVCVDSHTGVDSHKYDYGKSIEKARFCATPSGAGLDSYRMAEVMQMACVPVLIANGYVPPFASLLDWSKFSLAVDNEKVSTIPAILATIDERKKLRMTQHVAFVFDQFLSSKQRIAATMLASVQRNVKRACAA